MTDARPKPESVRFPPDVTDRLKQVAAERGQTFSDVIRTAALNFLGECPTCGQAIPAPGRNGKDG